jgi:hypothetical protein
LGHFASWDIINARYYNVSESACHVRSEVLTQKAIDFNTLREKSPPALGPSGNMFRDGSGGCFGAGHVGLVVELAH